MLDAIPPFHESLDTSHLISRLGNSRCFTLKHSVRDSADSVPTADDCLGKGLLHFMHCWWFSLCLLNKRQEGKGMARIAAALDIMSLTCM